LAIAPNTYAKSEALKRTPIKSDWSLSPTLSRL